VGRVFGIVVAGGSGSRYGAQKQFAALAGRTVAERSVAAARSVADRVVLVVPAGSGPAAHGADLVVTGGATRSASVRAGLAAVGEDAEVVVVHDAARPLARPELFAAVLDAVRAGAAGAICAVALSDTVKKVVRDDRGVRVLSTLERTDLVAVQTPQAFRPDALRRAHAGEPEATDDAALVEALGLEVAVVEGDPGNLKLTTPDDLARAERLLGA
jgi:2-C-methyl-D-erythritol 4-phosphate cytidylyltransferase